MTDKEFWLAPLHGITNYPLRNALQRHFGGIDACITPFLSVQSSGKANKRVWEDVFPENNMGVEVVPQLIGNEPGQFAGTMMYLNESFGYERFNVNLGCPSSKVVRHKRGCALMTDPDRVESIVETIASRTNFRLSLKMRLGLKDKSEIFEILRRMERYDLDFIVIHPRLGTDLYEGVVDMDTFAECVEMTRHKIMYSGDLFTKDDYSRLSCRFPQVSSWMSGRGLLRNPFLAEEITGKPKGDRKSRFIDFYEDYVAMMLSYRGKCAVLSHLKELWHYFAVFCKLTNEELTQLLRLDDLDVFLPLSRQIILM